LVTREIAAQIVVGTAAFVYFSPHLSFTQTRPILREIENLPQKSPPPPKKISPNLIQQPNFHKNFHDPPQHRKPAIKKIPPYKKKWCFSQF